MRILVKVAGHSGMKVAPHSGLKWHLKWSEATQKKTK
jgi:hypothetical protein